MKYNLYNILLIEDDEIDGRSFKRVFSKSPYIESIIESRSVEDGIAVLSQHQMIWPWIIILDLNLPGLNGIDFLKSIRSNDQYRNNTVFVLTSSNRERDVSDCFYYNISGYFEKPLETEGYENIRTFIESFISNTNFPEPSFS